MSIVRHKTFGKADRPTIYYLIGYGSRITQLKFHIRTLVLAGYRVVAFEYDKSILNNGNPAMLIQALDDLVATINHDKKKHKVAGLYGISLGSWLGANVLVRCGIQSGMFNTGAGNMVRVVWESSHFATEKKAFQQHGHTRESLQEAWGAHEFTPEGRRWQGKHALIMSSAGDEVLDIHQVRHNIQSWQKSGDDIHWLVSRRLRHGPVVVRNLFRLHRTPKFFKTL
jgi:predicted esterase YcpF (UPF0227 family)